MKNKYLLLARINLLRRKKAVLINIIIISISLLVVLVTSTLSKSIDNFVTTYLFNTLDFRTLNINTFKLQEGVKENLENIVNKDKRIIDFYEENFGVKVKMQDVGYINISENYKVDKTFGELSLHTFTKAYKDFMIAGEYPTTEDVNVGIIPKQFYPSSFLQIGYWKEKQDFIDGESLIGKTLTVEYYARDYSSDDNIIKTFTYSFKVIGVYDILPNQNSPF